MKHVAPELRCDSDTVAMHMLQLKVSTAKLALAVDQLGSNVTQASSSSHDHAATPQKTVAYSPTSCPSLLVDMHCE